MPRAERDLGIGRRGSAPRVTARWELIAAVVLVLISGFLPASAGAASTLTPTPSPPASPTPAVSPSPTPSPSPLPSPTPSSSPSPSPSPAPSPGATPSTGSAPSPSPSPAWDLNPPPSSFPPSLPANTAPAHPLAGSPAARPLSPQQQELAAHLTQADSALNRLRAQAAQNQREQTRLEAQHSGDEAELQQLAQKIDQLQAASKRLATRERQERARIALMARAINAEPSSVLLSVVEARSLGSYLTQDATLDGAAEQAHQATSQLESTRRQLQASGRSLTQKRNQASADEQQAQRSQQQLQMLAAQLRTQESQLQAQTSATQSEIASAQQAAQQQGGSVSGGQTALLSALGAGGLDQQALAAGLASGLYTLSSSNLRWPAQPDPSPLGLTAYPGYCGYTPIQCTCYAADAYQAYTGGALPQNLGNAGQWIGGARAAGIPTTQTPDEGALVVFNGPGYSVNGHVAIVRSVVLSGGSAIGLVVWERNLDEAGGFDVRLVALGSGSEIIGYIPPGV